MLVDGDRDNAETKGFSCPRGWCRRTWGWEERRVIRATAWFLVRGSLPLSQNLVVSEPHASPWHGKRGVVSEDGGLCHMYRRCRRRGRRRRREAVDAGIGHAETRSPCGQVARQAYRTGSINSDGSGEVMLGSEVRGEEGEGGEHPRDGRYGQAVGAQHSTRQAQTAAPGRREERRR